MLEVKSWVLVKVIKITIKRIPYANNMWQLNYCQPQKTGIQIAEHRTLSPDSINAWRRPPTKLCTKEGLCPKLHVCLPTSDQCFQQKPRGSMGRIEG